ncbi:hypothetical protein PC9H_003916 [Pleurotus ostreatus]|uniref:Maintenance of telomere capping protein 1 n=1 Tax=Pleurotus ostreatus TaxID=5322 RepID=A0A8H7A1V1_PLEOS|nr:uncharacterized protein PC9H_003916 [Pleurotus ostreatus]KAF7437082.1 hypothetical protein PC9H_003916 [Pleurotus ostreatus]KAJ8702928.1 hypothetical protein PTI98_001600 [Pleurotus ostreatus]
MSKSKHQEEVLQFLDDLDSFTPVEKPTGSEGSPSSLSAQGFGNPSPTVPNPNAQGKPGGEAEVLAFLDEITQKSAEPTHRTPGISLTERPSSRAGTPSLRKPTERVRVGSSSPLLPASSGPATPSTTAGGTGAAEKGKSPEPSASTASKGGWGWGSVWTTASAAIQQAKTAVDEQVKNLPNNEQARKWSEGVMEYAKTAQLDKLGKDFKQLGLSTLTDILNVVAPPISEHEVIQIWLSHDMRGYDGVESLVYRSLSRVLEQVEGGDLIVNRGDESKPKTTGDEGRELNAVEGYEAASKLAQANIDEIIKVNVAKTAKSDPSSTQTPTTYSHVYLRIQPFLSSLTIPSTKLPAAEDGTESPQSEPETHSQLQYLLHLSDPEHLLVCATVTQTVPGHWLELWDQYDWVEDSVAESLRVGLEVIGQEYLVKRMGWAKGKKAQTNDEIQGGEAGSKPTEV